LRCTWRPKSCEFGDALAGHVGMKLEVYLDTVNLEVVDWEAVDLEEVD